MRLFEKTPEAMTGSRIAAVDYAKTLAIVCVVMIHVSSEVLLGRQIGSAAWLEGLFWSSLARGAVPLFLMCSGVLFLDRSGGLSVRRIWKRNIPHILLALLVWAAVYKLVPRFLHEKLTAEALRTILLELLCGQHEGHLYFLHIMLLVYAALPVTYTFAANADEKTERYALAFWIVSGVLLPTAKGLGLLHAFSGIFLQWPLMLAWAAIGCTWLGHFLMNRDPLPVHLAAAMLLAGFLICFAGTWPSFWRRASVCTLGPSSRRERVPPPSSMIFSTTACPSLSPSRSTLCTPGAWICRCGKGAGRMPAAGAFHPACS